MKFIVGKKLEMSQVFTADGNVVPVTIVQAGPCLITQVKTASADGYTAIQVGYGTKKSVSKPLAGHTKGLGILEVLKEFRLEEGGDLSRGQQITTQIFAEGDVVKVTGTSKGKGFQGVVKRHGFHGQGGSHGVKDQMRMPGSSGAQGPQHVFKGIKKPGRMGGDQVSVANLVIVKKDDAANLLYIKGAIPGARHSVVTIVGPGEMKLNLVEAKPIAEVPSAPVVTPAEASPVQA